MENPDRPKLRSNLALARDQAGRLIVHDPYHIGTFLPLDPAHLEVAKQLNGRNSIHDLSRFGLSLEHLVQFIHALDETRLLDGPHFQNYLNQQTRPPSCIGAYPEQPAAIRETVRKLFTQPGGAGLPQPGSRTHDRLRGILVPHMDYPRGNITYGYGFKELIERSPASLFVILATSHYSPERFSITRMDYSSPLGIVKTDQHYLDRIVKHFGDEAELTRDRLAHFPEHSIELEVVILQAMLDRPFRIVPILCGSFHDAIQVNRSPAELPDVAKMIKSLQLAEAESQEEICTIISGDLAHIGPKFGDPQPVDSAILEHSKFRDQAILNQLTYCDAEGYFQEIASEADARRICGLPPTYLAMKAIQPTNAVVHHVQQFVHPQGFESVSFAAASFV